MPAATRILNPDALWMSSCGSAQFGEPCKGLFQFALFFFAQGKIGAGFLDHGFGGAVYEFGVVQPPAQPTEFLSEFAQ